MKYVLGLYFVVFHRIKHTDLLLILRPDNEAIFGRNRILPDNKHLISGRIGYPPDIKIVPDIRPDRGRNRISGAPLLITNNRGVLLY